MFSVEVSWTFKGSSTGNGPVGFSSNPGTPAKSSLGTNSPSSSSNTKSSTGAGSVITGPPLFSALIIVSSASCSSRDNNGFTPPPIVLLGLSGLSVGSSKPKVETGFATVSVKVS